MRFQTDPLVINGDMSGNITSTVQDLNQMMSFSVQAVFTGAPVGSIKLQASVDNVTFTDVANSTFAIAAAGDVMWNYTIAGYRYLRVVYTRSSGTGTLNVKWNGKG